MWLVGERMVRRLNEDMYLGSGFEVQWCFLVEGGKRKGHSEQRENEALSNVVSGM